MLELLSWIIFIALLAMIAFYRIAAKIYLPVFGLLLLMVFLFHRPMIISVCLLSVLWWIAVIIAIVKPLRYRLITLPMKRWFKRQQPELSQAELTALQAGGLWFEQQFFQGQPNWRQLNDIKISQLTSEEQAFLDNEVTQLCQMLDEWSIRQAQDLPQAVWHYLKQHKFFGLTITKEYQGLGFSAQAHSAIITKIASRSYSTAIMTMVPNSLGPAEFLHYYGTKQQKAFYLPQLARGQHIPCFGLTGNHAGSDAASITDIGIVCYGDYQDKKQVLGIRLNWDKRYITLAPIATLIGLAFRLKDPDQLLGQQKNIGITLALIPTDLPGIEKGKRHRPLGQPFLNGPIRGRDVFIAMDCVIGGQQQCGKGWQMLMECLAVGRGISLPSLSAAISQKALQTTIAYAHIREQFRQPIAHFDGVKVVLARMAGLSFLCESARQFTVQAVASDARPAIASAITKYHTTEYARQVVNDAMDIHAGKAIQTGPRNYLFDPYCAVPINVSVEGANIMTRNLIIFGQGVMRGHPYLREEIQTANNNYATKKWDNVLWRHLGFIAQQSARLIVYGLTRAKWLKTTHCDESLTYYYRQLSYMSTALIVMTDLTLALVGSELKRKETLSARLGDILSNLYLASSTLHFVKAQKTQQTQRLLLDWSLTYCLHQIQCSLVDLLANYPSRILARLMRRIIFPWGLPYHYPSDQMSFQLVDWLKKQSNSLSQTICTDQTILALWRTLDQLQPIIKKCRAKIKSTGNNQLAQIAKRAKKRQLITNDEFKQLIQCAKMIDDVIAVDEF